MFATTLSISSRFLDAWIRSSTVHNPVQCLMLRSQDIFFRPTPLLPSIFPSMISCSNPYFALRITCYPCHTLMPSLSHCPFPTRSAILLTSSHHLLLADPPSPLGSPRSSVAPRIPLTRVNPLVHRSRCGSPLPRVNLLVHRSRRGSPFPARDVTPRAAVPLAPHPPERTWVRELPIYIPT